MKLRFLTLLITTLLILQNINVFAQEEKDDATLSTEIYSDALKLARKKKWEKALAKFEKSRTYWQHYNEALLFEKIIKDIEAEAIDDKVAKDGFKALGEGYFDNKTKKALKRINKLIKKFDSYWPLYVVKARLHNNRDQLEKAETAFAKALELSENAALVYVLRGKYYASQDEREKAIADFSAAIKNEPSAVNYFERGFIYCLERDYDLAIKDFEKAARQKPEWQKSTIVLEAYHNRGVELVQKKSSKRSLRYFNQAIKIDPNYTTAYLNRGIAYKNVKQYTNAIKDFTHCINQNPGLRAPYYERALTHYQRKHYSKAAADLESLLKIMPEDKRALSKIADAYEKAGKPDKSIVYLDKLIELDERYYWAYYHKGFAYTSLRKGKRAIDSFKTFIALAPKQYYKQIATAEVEIEKLRRQGY